MKDSEIIPMRWGVVGTHFFRTEFLLSQRSSSCFYLRTMIRPVLLCMKGDYGYQLIGDVASLGFTVNGLYLMDFGLVTMNKK